MCQGRYTWLEAKCGVKLSEDDLSCPAGGFEKTIQARDSGYKHVEGDLLSHACEAHNRSPSPPSSQPKPRPEEPVVSPDHHYGSLEDLTQQEPSIESCHCAASMATRM